MAHPLVAIVGAPNVGKSTLFNRLVGGRRAIVSDEPGVTRDRLYGEVTDAERPFRLVDTGGMTLGEDAPLAREVERQAELALAEADVVLFVVDARVGATGLDRDLAQLLRKSGRGPILVANKVDVERAVTRVHELHGLGLGPPVELSAEHGLGVPELLEAIASRLPEVTAHGGDEPYLSVAIVGRPNVGKSSIVNRLLGEERVVVSERPGTTRDAIDTLLEVGPRRYRLIDTAGLRRSGRIRRGVERSSAQRARENIERCDVAVLVLDSTDELAAQDAHIAGYILDALKPMIVAINKWDRVLEREEAVKDWQERVRYRLRFTRDAPLLFTSALSGQRVSRILDAVDDLHAAGGVEVPTSLLNRWLQGLPAAGAKSDRGGPGFRAYYATQTGVHPPRFVLFCNDPARAHFSVRRHLENSLRRSFGFGPAPIRVTFRRRRGTDEP